MPTWAVPKRAEDGCVDWSPASVAGVGRIGLVFDLDGRADIYVIDARRSSALLGNRLYPTVGNGYQG
jgi:hypothetical protein